MVNDNYSRYRPVLVEFMSFFHQTEYKKDAVFTADELDDIKDVDIVDFFNHKTYGRIDPTPNDRPKVRSNSLFAWKSALSSFMPNKNMQWKEILHA